MPGLPPAGRPVLVQVPVADSRPAARQQLRAVLGKILAHWSGLPTAKLPLVETSAGPAWHGALHGIPVAISFSYAPGSGWLALCRGAAVGVDAMVPEPFPEMADVARLYLGPKVADSLIQAADPGTAFARAWTRREASLKCFKRGLAEWFDGETLPPVTFQELLPPSGRLLVTVAVAAIPASDS
jgi:4'-phosphopantetheinyl transferase